MRIGFDISDLSTDRADGTTRYTKELAKAFASLSPDTDWVYFAPNDSTATKEVSEGKANVNLRLSPWPKFWTQLRLPREVYGARLNTLFMPIQQLPLLRPRKVKTVAVVHDLAFHLFPEQFTYKDWLLLHIFSAQVAREADQIIAVSQATADDIDKFYGRRENVHVIHHGVDHDFFREMRDEDLGSTNDLLADMELGSGDKFILYVGQLQPRKNLIRLIEAFEKISDNELKLVIAGSHGWLKEPILNRVKNSTKTNEILMPGRVSDEQLRALYWKAKAFILPSLYEGFGMPILEAMASGCAVVTANVSSMPEVAGEAAVLVDPGSSLSIKEGIETAINRKDDLKILGIAQAAKFNWDKTARKTLGVLGIDSVG